MKILKVFLVLLLCSLLTLLSQIGGVILLIWLLVFWSFKKKIKNVWARRATNIFGFMGFYMLFVLAIIPMLARLQHRAPLPMTKSGNLVPVTYWNVVFMRNYIITSGKEKMVKIADEFAQKHPGLKVKYMDCNYPFLFVKGRWILESLFPHITHRGNQADIAFIYNDKNGIPTNYTPTAIGYGSSVDPLPNEPCTPCNCEKSNWQYSFMHNTLPKKNYRLNNNLSSFLVQLAKKRTSGNIIIEKHLQKRFNLHGAFTEAPCKSVRHDDHFHVKFE